MNRNPECAHSPPASETMGYTTWIEFAEAHARKQIKQSRCPNCKRFFFPCQVEGAPECGCGVETYADSVTRELAADG